MDGQVCGLGTVHPLLTVNFFSTWILPLRVVSSCVSTLKMKLSSPAMDGLQRRRRYHYSYDGIGNESQSRSNGNKEISEINAKYMYTILAVLS